MTRLTQQSLLGSERQEKSSQPFAALMVWKVKSVTGGLRAAMALVKSVALQGSELSSVMTTKCT